MRPAPFLHPLGMQVAMGFLRNGARVRDKLFGTTRRGCGGGRAHIHSPREAVSQPFTHS